MMLFFLSQLLALFILGMAILSFSRLKVYRWVIGAFMSFWLVLEIASVYLGGNLIDYKFWEHFNVHDVLLTWKLFIPQLILGVVVFAGFSGLFLILANWLDRQKWARKPYMAGVAVLCVAGMSVPDGVIRNVYEFNQLQQVKVSSFQASLEALQIPPDQYPLPEAIQASPGKNIIVLSLESFERGYLQDNLAYLTPNMRRLATEGTFLPVQPAKGSDFTTAALYTFFTGLPMYFKGERRSIFRQAESTSLAHLGLILNTAGYHQRYLIGNAKFGGEDEMLKLLGVKVWSRGDFETEYPHSEWGLHDLDLFSEIKRAVQEEAESGSPFAIYASTISTHGPDGIYDKRMEAFVDPQSSNLEFAAASLDYLIGDLVAFLETEGLLDSTVFYLLPDHQLMGPTINVGKKFKKPRGLYVLTNAPTEDLPVADDTPLYQIDLPRIVLAGAGVTHNARFLTEFIPGDKGLFLEKNKKQLLALNESSLHSSSLAEDLVIGISIGDEVFVQSGNTRIDLPELDDSGNEAVRLEFNQRMQARVHTGEAYQIFVDPVKGRNLYLTRTGKKLTAFFRQGHQNILFKSGLGELVFTRQELEQSDDMTSFLRQQVNRYPQEPLYRQHHNNTVVQVTSSSYGPQTIQTPTQILAGTRMLDYDRGINVLRFLNGRYQIDKFDTFGSEEEAGKLVELLSELQRNKAWFVLVLDVALGENLKPYRQQLIDLGFERLANLGKNQAYLAYGDLGWVNEQSNRYSLSLSFPYHRIPSARTRDQILANGRDPQRFIAHAGGSINGHVYTNTLEALDANYRKGFRLFELDIVRTLDGHYVAAHDWDTWRRQSEYDGFPPVSLEDFLDQDILGQYTPLDMDRINDWFARHPDAILVTDKVNQPKKFAEQFVDKSRLMMELFSTEAIEEGLEAGIRAVLPSMNVITGLPGDRVAWLQERGIEHIAVSIDLLYQDPTLFDALEAAGIRTYLFHINSNPWVDEAHVVQYEMDRIYGLYADDWSFE